MLLRAFLTAFLFSCFLPTTLAATQPFERGLLWRIDKPGLAPSYAFGTIHIDDPRVLDVPPSVTRALRQSTTFTMEMLTDETAHRKFTRASRLRDGKELPAVLGPDLYGQVAEKMQERGVPDAATRQLKPWSVMLTLLLPRERPVVILDYALYQAAQEQKKPVFALETVEEQIDTFDGMPIEVQIELLESVVRHEDEIPGMTKELIRAYLDRDLKRMWDINARFTSLDPGTEAANAIFLERVLFARNQRMTHSIQPRLETGGAFLAVGALHLYGERGILALLAQQGYRITRVY
jgi:uncharacterized protein YbaP (TraB family)